MKIWLSQKRKELLKTNFSFQKKKTFFFVSKLLSIRRTKQIGKNIADTTFKYIKYIMRIRCIKYIIKYIKYILSHYIYLKLLANYN